MQLSLPEAALRPCALNRLPDSPTVADLEIAYVERGARLVACDGARRLAVEGWLAEREVVAGRQDLPSARQKLPHSASSWAESAERSHGEQEVP